MTDIDKAHTVIGSFALAMVSLGAWRAWGDGYGMLVLGGVLLAGVIYARI